MRYQLHQQIWTIALDLINKETNKPYTFLHFQTPVPNLFTIQAVRFTRLTVSEHHKVPGEWSDDIQYDGFICLDDKQRVWHNQYPRACYGQMSDSADGEFSPVLISDLCKQHKDSGKSFDDICAMVKEQGSEISVFDLCRFMNELDGGMLNSGGLVERYAKYPELMIQLEEISAMIQQKFREQTGLVLQSHNNEWGTSKNNGEKIIFKEWKIAEA